MTNLEPKITYMSTPAEIEAMHGKFDEALEEVEKGFGQDLPMIINGEDRAGSERFEVIAPAHTSTVLATLPKASHAEVDEAVSVAEAFQPEWAAKPPEVRVRIIKSAANKIRERKFVI